jgi:hypothetical protein
LCHIAQANNCYLFSVWYLAKNGNDNTTTGIQTRKEMKEPKVFLKISKQVVNGITIKTA